MITKNELRQYRYIKSDIKQLEEEIKELELLMVVPGCQKLTGMPGGGGIGDKIGELVAKADKLRRIYRRKVSRLLDLKAEIEAAIEILNEEEQLLIRLYYFAGKTWECTAVEMGVSWATVHRDHRKILYKLAGQEWRENDDT